MVESNSGAKSTTDNRSTDLETTLLADGQHINVRNTRSGSGEIHTVHLTENGSVKRCTCKGWVFHETCYHVDTVRNSPILLSSAKVQVAQSQQVATDGGHSEDDRFRLPEDPKHVDERDVVDVHGCAACGGYAYGSDKFCSDKCRERGEVDETPL
jgi:hypothetical protein